MSERATSGFCLSPQQRRVYPRQGTGSFNAAALVLLEGPVCQTRLRDALSEVVSRHEVLRTVFRRLPGMKFPFQVVLETAGAGWAAVSLEGCDEAAQCNSLDELFRQAQGRKFNLEHGPVVNACLAALGETRFALILSLPALSSDLRSLQTLIRELLYLCRKTTGRRVFPLCAVRSVAERSDRVRR